MILIAIYLLYAFSLLMAFALGLLLWKKHSIFPDMRVGYHVTDAMRGEEEWEYANACAGKTSMFGGVLAFAVFPAACLFLRLSAGRMALLYCCVCLLWSLAVLVLPLYLLRKKGSKGHK